MFLAFTALRDVRFREVSLENDCFWWLKMLHAVFQQCFKLQVVCLESIGIHFWFVSNFEGAAKRTWLLAMNGNMFCDDFSTVFTMHFSRRGVTQRRQQRM